jgi:LysR family transcriptional regulator of abg operon
MKDMKLHALQALIAAVEEGSLRSAARRIGLSQPALTKLIRELERELGAPLLLRSTTGVVATAQGQVLYASACTAVRELGGAVAQITQLSGRMVGELSISAVPLVMLLLIPETLRTFSREFPDIQLRLAEELYLGQLTKLRNGEIDLAIGPLPAELPAGEFSTEILMPIEMCVVARKGSIFSQARSLHELTRARWVYTNSSGVKGYSEVLFSKHGLPAPPVGAVVNSTLTLLSVISSSDCLGLMPKPTLSHPLASELLSVVPVQEGSLALTVGAIVKTEALLKPTVRHFMTHLHRAAHHHRAAI